MTNNTLTKRNRVKQYYRDDVIWLGKRWIQGINVKQKCLQESFINSHLRFFIALHLNKTYIKLYFKRKSQLIYIQKNAANYLKTDKKRLTIRNYILHTVDFKMSDNQSNKLLSVRQYFD